MKLTDGRVYLMAAGCVLAVAASLLLPRLVRDEGGGFAAATSAALIFIALAVAGVIASIVLFLYVLQRREELSRRARIAGLTPTLLIAAGSCALWVLT